MMPAHWNSIIVKAAIFLLLCTYIHVVNARRSQKYICPIGFSLAFPKYKDKDPICYRRKGPETFADKFYECSGNLYTSKLYHSLNFTEPNLVLWTEYKSLYPGGPFIDWSYTKSIGEKFGTTHAVKYDTRLGLDEELCVVIDPISNFTATRCNEMHYRYCFVEPYPKEDDMDTEGCEEFDDFWRFWAPKPTCLARVSNVRANWRQAKDLCVRKGGSLLSKGWRYANNPLLYSKADPTFPLGVVLSPDNTTIRFDTASDNTVIPASEWNFEVKNVSTNTAFGALHDSFWFMVNGTYLFYDVICERPIQLKTVSLNVTVLPDQKLVLTVNDSVDESDIRCFTDSVSYQPFKVKTTYDNDENYYVLKPTKNGYYWCVHVDSKNYYVTESNKALFIRTKQSLVNSFAIKLRLKKEYKLDDLANPLDTDWQDNITKKLEEYIFYRTKYVQIFEELEPIDLKRFKASHPGLVPKRNGVIYNSQLKRLFLDGKTVLVHYQLDPAMMLAPPGVWEDVEVVFMKPVYYCKGFDSVPTLPLGESITTVGCRTHRCVGDFNEGVQWVTTAAEGCTTPTPISSPVTQILSVNPEVFDMMPTASVITTSTASDMSYIRDKTEESSEETQKTSPPKPRPTSTEATTTDFNDTTTVETTTVEMTTIETTTEVVTTVELTTEHVSTAFPTTPEPTTPVPPEEQLKDILEDLQTLLENDTVPLMFEDIDPAFDQVDTLLETEDNLQIPGELLHLLDQLGSRIDLNGSQAASAVRSNIAMLLADAQPGAPIRGLRIAAQEDDVFTDEAFEIITEKINSTHLTANESQAVVHLPESVASSSRRITFVVFRNDRAFQSSHGIYSVNSRVLSINVENITHFEAGETIDIHLCPITQDPDRNMSRTCAYWHFLEDGTGYWSEEGCTLIKSAEDGVLDTCRCNHLTHFAEILIPKTVFSQKNEDALEILSIIGCCLSIFGLVMIVVTAALFRSWRRDFSNKVWLQLCIAIFLLVISFLVITFARFDMYNIPCMLIGVLLHYSVLASFCWMLVAAVLSYRRLVIVFSRDASHKLLRASAFAWGFPCAIVGILLSVSPHSYAGGFEEKTSGVAFCYPSGLGLWLAVYAPITLMLLANWVLFALIVRSVFASRRIQRHGDTNEAVRCASVSCLLVFLFGLPWVFGLFAYNIVAAYLFTLTATFQGFVLFLFFVLGNKKTRDLWLNKLKIKQTRKVPVTSSTYTHRSTAPGNRGGQTPSSIEANSSKPRSLASPDNSRFS